MAVRHHLSKRTVSTKVVPEQARQLYTELAAGWEPFLATGEGLLLWHYLGEPWELAGEERFAGAGRSRCNTP